MRSTIINIVLEIMRSIEIVLQCCQLEMRSTITSGGLWLWWWRRVWRLDLDLFLRRPFSVVVYVSSLSSLSIFSSREVSLYRGPFTKVVLFDLAVSVETIWPEFLFLQYSWSLNLLVPLHDPWFLWVVGNLVSLTLM